MTLGRQSSVADVAATVGRALKRFDVQAVLTGGACAMLYSKGAYQSHDLDFVVTGRGTRKAIDDAMASIGFRRERDRYVHPRTPLFIEFPPGPLAIGDDLAIRPVQLRLKRGSTLALSATDACRDRLSAFYHWSDRQSLQAAVEIALRHRVILAAIKRWSQTEGAMDKFEEFRREVMRRRRGRGAANRTR